MATRYSHSRLSTFETCPRQYQYRYIERRPRPGPGVEAHMGASVHSALEMLYDRLRGGGEPPSRPDVVKAFEAAWETVPAEQLRVVKSGFTRDDYRELGRHCVESYYDASYPFIDGEILAVEKKVDIRLDRQGRYLLVGYIDRLSRAADGTLEIHDYKTSGSLPRPRDLEDDRQLALYEMGLRQDLAADTPVRHVWHYLAFGQRFERLLSRDRLLGIARDVKALIDRVEATVGEGGELAARPGVLCHWCDFNDLCPEGQEERRRRSPPGLPRAGD